MLTNENITASNKIYPSAMAARIWLLTSLALGIGSFIYFILSGSDDGAMSILVAICALIASLPALLVLVFAVSHLDNLPLRPVSKIKRLAYTCLGCISPYAFIGADIFTGSYNNPH